MERGWEVLLRGGGRCFGEGGGALGFWNTIRMFTCLRYVSCSDCCTRRLGQLVLNVTE